MSPELIAVVGSAIALAGLIVSGQRSLRQDLGADIAGLDARIETLRAETKADIAGLETRIEALRQEVKTDIETLRQEVKTDIETLRAETKADSAALRQDLGELRERMAHLDGMLDGLREAIFSKAA